MQGRARAGLPVISVLFSALLLQACANQGDERPAELAESEQPAPSQEGSQSQSGDNRAPAFPVATVSSGTLAPDILNATDAESSSFGPVGGAGSVASGPAAALPEGVGKLLAQAEWALDAGRLTHPPGFNARDFFQQALQLDPGNAAARKGLQRVLDRSIEFSLLAAKRGNFKRAELLLTRAERFSLNDPGIRGAREYIHRLSRQGQRSFELPAAAVRARDGAGLAETLKLIVRRAVENDAMIEIHTADDLQGLWLFDQLRQHAGKEPLHATIQAAQEPEIRLTWRR